MTDCLKNSNDCLANFVGGESMRLRYIDLVDTIKDPSKIDTRTGAEIREDIGNKLDEIGAL